MTPPDAEVAHALATLLIGQWPCPFHSVAALILSSKRLTAPIKCEAVPFLLPSNRAPSAGSRPMLALRAAVANAVRPGYARHEGSSAGHVPTTPCTTHED